MARAFYSLMQYCPDRFRAEAVNVGLVLLCPEPHDVRVRVASRHDRVRKFFGVSGGELKNFKLSIHGLKSRIEGSVDELLTPEDLTGFAASRANDLRLTEPRLAKIEDIDDDVERLFSELVEDSSSVVMAYMSPAEVLPPKLSEVFYRLQQERKIWKPGKITVPVYRRKMDIPYAYQNGIVNFVKPYVFADNRRAESQAATLAINGDLIHNHPEDGEKRQLIVVSTQENAEQAKEVTEHVEPLFREYGVRLVRPAQAESFAEEVEASAH